MYKILV